MAGARLTIFFAGLFAGLFAALFVPLFAGVRLAAFLGAFFATLEVLADLRAFNALAEGVKDFSSGRGAFSFRMSFNIALAANRAPREAAMATGAPV
ncbi:MAG: hypothetical protein ABSH04_03135 [Acidimicrobiales bacterium]